MITHSIEINRSPEDVFAYLDQLERHGEWQGEIVSATRETDGPVGVGTRVREIRKMGRREIDASYEITEHDPPRRTAFRGTVGAIRPVGTVTIESAGDSSSARGIQPCRLRLRQADRPTRPQGRTQADRGVPGAPEGEARGGRLS